MKRAFALTMSLAAAVSLAACSSSASSDADASSSSSSAEGQFPVTVEHALGTTTIEEQPERVVTLGWGGQDTALALGIAPVGLDDETWSMDGSDGLGVYEWTSDAYEELGAEEPVVFSDADGVDFEAVADAQPDVILAAYSGITADDYATLSEIAPTVAYPDAEWITPWRDAIEINATALGLADEGTALVDDLEQQIADATADSDFSGKTAAFFYIGAEDLSTISVYSDLDSRTAFLTDLGFDLPAVADSGEDESFYTDVSAENADQLDDVDVIVSYGDDSLLEALQADPLWSTVPAVQNGAVVTVGSGAEPLSGAVTPTALSIPWMLENGYVDLLDDAVAQGE